jgi:hypothetical protein
MRMEILWFFLMPPALQENYSLLQTQFRSEFFARYNSSSAFFSEAVVPGRDIGSQFSQSAASTSGECHILFSEFAQQLLPDTFEFIRYLRKHFSYRTKSFAPHHGFYLYAHRRQMGCTQIGTAGFQ